MLGETDNFMIADASSEIDIDEHKAKALAENEKAVQAKRQKPKKLPSLFTKSARKSSATRKNAE